MNKRKYEKILREIAKKHGVSVKEVRRDIDAALKDAQSQPDCTG